MTQSISSQQLALLVDRHGPALRLYASQWTLLPDDCVQEALIELAGQLPPPASPVGWLYRVVRLRAHNRHRAERRRRGHERSAGERLRVDPAETVEVRDLLEQLDATVREVVVLRVWGGLTYEEIATVTQRSASSLQRDYQSALARLRVLMNLEPSQVPYVR